MRYFIFWIQFLSHSLSVFGIISSTVAYPLEVKSFQFSLWFQIRLRVRSPWKQDSLTMLQTNDCGQYPIKINIPVHILRFMEKTTC